MDTRLTFKSLIATVSTGLFLVGAGSINIALASENPTSHGTASTSASYRMHVADNRMHTLAKQHTKDIWVCPMHPEIHQHESGKCPICKMNLVKEKPKKL